MPGADQGRRALTVHLCHASSGAEIVVPWMREVLALGSTPSHVSVSGDLDLGDRVVPPGVVAALHSCDVVVLLFDRQGLESFLDVAEPLRRALTVRRQRRPTMRVVLLLMGEVRLVEDEERLTAARDWSDAFLSLSAPPTDADAERLAKTVFEWGTPADDGPICGACGARSHSEFCATCGSYMLWSAGTPRFPAEPVPPPPARRPADDGAPASLSHSPPAPLREPRRKWQLATRPRRHGSRPVDAVVLAARDEHITPGLASFNPPESMKQGRAERVEVSVTRDTSLRAELNQGLRGRGLPVVEDVRTSPFMSVRLLGSSFRILDLSPREQLVVPTARWEFDVVPLHFGTQVLTLSVCVRIALPGRGDELIASPVLERQIKVSVSPMYSTSRFIRDNWQWVAATALGLGGSVGAWRALGGPG